MENSFKQIWQKNIPELDSKALMYVHEKTKAEILFILNNDEERVFSVGFRTIPEDSTGVAHIVEHSVLGGSKKYQVKEPFVHLVKSSVNSYVNAFTSTECTIYPVASANKVDFYNLMEVYLDSVYQPLITERTFMQEGWHYELSEEDPKLKYKGVVFNEMKGSIANPAWANWQGITAGLFPTNTYQFDSGGNPESIPDLTYQQFLDFYKKFYHPSNSRTYFYGDLDVEEALSKLSEYLDLYDYQEVDGSIPKVAAFPEPKKVENTYAVTETDESKPNAYSQLAWALELEEPLAIVKWWILEEILTGSDASPLRNKLIQSGLGEGIAGWGLASGQNQDIYFIGLKGVKNENVSKVHELIIDTLTEMSKSIDPKLIEASMNSIEFSLREITEGGVTGIDLMRSVIDEWYQGRDPIGTLAFVQIFEQIRNELLDNPDLFSEIIKTDLLENTHRIDFSMLPDSELTSKREELENTRLEKLQQGMSESELEQIKRQTIEIKQWQDSQDSEEEVNKIPRLEVSDLDRKITTVVTEPVLEASIPVRKHDISSRGITYFDLSFDSTWLTKNDYPYYVIFLYLLTRLSTKNRSYEELALDEDTNTGGIWTEVDLGKVYGQEKDYALTTIRGKVLSRKQQDLIRLIKEIVADTLFTDTARIKQLLLERKAGIENGIVSSGHNWSLRRSRAKLDKYYAAHEAMFGTDFYLFLSELTQNFDSRAAELTANLNSIRDRVLDSKMMINFTAPETDWETMSSLLDAGLVGFPQKLQHQNLDISAVPSMDEGFTVPAKVNYVSLAAQLSDEYKPHGSVLAISNILAMDYLWNNVRAKGGAYGSVFRYDKYTNQMGFSSYRDPNIENTLKIYREAGEYLLTHEFTKGDIDGAIIGAIGSLDQPQTPIDKGWGAYIREITGWTDELRQQYRDELLSTSIKDIHAFGEVLKEASKSGVVTVFGNKQDLENYSAKVSKLEVKQLI